MVGECLASSMPPVAPAKRCEARKSETGGIVSSRFGGASTGTRLLGSGGTGCLPVADGASGATAAGAACRCAACGGNCVGSSTAGTTLLSGKAPARFCPALFPAEPANAFSSGTTADGATASDGVGKVSNGDAVSGGGGGGGKAGRQSNADTESTVTSPSDSSSAMPSASNSPSAFSVSSASGEGNERTARNVSSGAASPFSPPPPPLPRKLSNDDNSPSPAGAETGATRLSAGAGGCGRTGNAFIRSFLFLSLSWRP